MSEPAILVKRKQRGSQVWAMEKFENKLFDMRDMYEERKDKGLPMMVDDELDFIINLESSVCGMFCFSCVHLYIISIIRILFYFIVL